MKKLVSLLLSLVMVFSLVSAFADDGNVPEFTIAVKRNAQQYVSQDELPFWQMVQKELGIKINWIEIPATSVQEKVNLMLAGGDDLPDAFIQCISNDMLSTYYDQDVFVAIEDYLDQMPNLSNVFEQRPQYKALATFPNGHMYGFPYIEEMYGLVLTNGPTFINAAWLEKVGKEMPTTVEEFKEALIAFRDAGDLNGNGEADEIPYTLAFGNTHSFDSHDTFNMFCNAFGMQHTAGGSRFNDYLAVVDGEVVFTGANEAFKETCNFFNELYSEGLIDINAFAPAADKSVAHYTSVLSASDVAVYGCFGIWNINTYMQNPEVLAQYKPLPRLQGPAGKTGERINMSEMQDVARFVISTECEDIDTMIKLVDFLYKPEISVQANNGMAGYVMMYDENGCLRENLDENGNVIYPEGSGWTSTNDARYNTRGEKMCSAVLNEYYDVLVSYDFGAKPIIEGQRGNGKEEVLAELECFPPVLLTAEEAAIVSQIQPQLRNILESFRMDAIMNGTADAAWDGYLTQLNNAGLDQFMNVYKTAYARYLELVK